MTVFINNPTNSLVECLELTNTFSKIPGYIMNSQNLVTLLYTNGKWTEKEIREISFTNNIKSLGVSLSKQVENLYDKNFKSLKKEIEEINRR